MQNMQVRRAIGEEPFRFHPHPLRSNPTYPLPIEGTNGTTYLPESNQAALSLPSSCSNEICTHPQSSDLIQCVAFDITNSEEPSLQSVVSQPDQLTTVQTVDCCSPLLCHERISPILNEPRATDKVCRYGSQPTLPAISNSCDHSRANPQDLKPTRKELRIMTTMDSIDVLGKRRPQIDHSPQVTPLHMIHSSYPDLISGLSKELADTNFLATGLLECTDHVAKVPTPTTATDLRREGKLTLSLASSCQTGQRESEDLKSLMPGPEHLTGHEGGKRHGNVFFPTAAVDLRFDADTKKFLVMPVPDIPIRASEVFDFMTPKTRASSTHGERLDLNTNVKCLENTPVQSNSIQTGQCSPSSIFTASSNIIMMQQSHCSPVSPIAVASHKSSEGCADDHLGLIVFYDVPDIELKDRKDWPPPGLEEPDAQSLKTFLLEDADDTDVRNRLSGTPPVPMRSGTLLESPHLHRRRTGFIMQKRSSSIASLHSYRLGKRAELPGPAMMLLRNAGRAPSCSDTRTPRSGSPTPLKDMSCVAGSITRKFHLQRDLGGKRSVAVMTPVSEAWDMLTGGVGWEARTFSSETFRSKLKVDGIGKSWLKWEFKGGLVGEA